MWGRSWWCSHACVVGAWVGNVAEHVTWRDSGSCLSCAPVSCLRAAACSASLSSEIPSIQSLPAPGSARDPSQTPLAEARSNGLARAEHCRSFPQPCLLSPPTSSHLPAPSWPGQSEDFCLDAFQAGHYHSCLICCLKGLHFLSQYSCVMHGAGHINKGTLVGDESDLYNSCRVWSCCDV